MEKEPNIAAILKEKPLYTKLWSDTFGDMFLTECLVDSFNVKGRDDNLIWTYLSNGTFKKYMGTLSIFPSNSMRDWEKFAWKKGDVLCGYLGNICIFDKWANDQYTEFYGRYPSPTYSKEGDKFDTESWSSGIEGIVKATFIKNIEEHYGGKLNLETLEIEQPKPEFKDGDIVTHEESNHIYILKEWDSIMDRIFYYGCLDTHSSIGLDCSDGSHHLEYPVIRLATESEKQQLFDALAREGKRWNPDTLQIEDLPKKCEFEPLDYVLVKSKENHSLWNLYQFAFKGINLYCMVGNICLNRIDYNFLPYNDQTKHLLGTTNEWKGGEV